MSQFTSQDGKQTLGDYFDVPKDVYAVGRLDYDSEGLLILTNDKRLNHQLLNPSNGHVRTYWVQVDGAITQAAINTLETGVDINIDGKIFHTTKCAAAIIEPAPAVPERIPPVRFRKSIPTSWISLSIIEGKNRQVRKMTAAVGFPTLRLIRYSIEKCKIAGLAPGEMQLLSATEIQQLLFKK